jgi:hypothetical protein
VALSSCGNSDDGSFSKEKQRQFFFLGMGLYGAIFVVNVTFLVAFEYSKPQIALIRILAPAFTVPITFIDSAFLRSICRKQLSDSSIALSKWPINIPEYPTWIYGVYIFLSFVISGYLLSRF